MKSAERTITTERLSRYLRATKQNLSKAIELYELNVHLSEILYGLLHGLEVTIRNAEHLALSISFGTPFWYDRPATLDFGQPQLGAAGPSWHEHAALSPYWMDQIAAAKTKPGAAGKPGEVVAELTFGFWVDLIQQNNHRSLWVGRRLHSAFPNAHRKRADIHDRLKTLQLLRNRISHQEPVLTSSNGVFNGTIVVTMNEIMECAEWVCLDTAAWMKTQFRLADAVKILGDVHQKGLVL